MRIAVIGAGVVGALLARELSRYEAEILLFERELEPGFGVTKANSAIVHAGFHDEPGALRARFCVQGNALFPEVCAELGVPFRRTGALVLALAPQEIPVLKRLLAQGEENGAAGLALLRAEEVLAREPRANPQALRGLWAPTAGVTEPWSLAQAAVENAVLNKVEFHPAERVDSLKVQHARITGLSTPQGSYPVDAVINAAGLYADEVAWRAGVQVPPIRPRRGQYILLGKLDAGWRGAHPRQVQPEGVRTILFPCPSPKSKGILVVPTVDGSLLLGPTAEDLPPEEKEATETTAAGLKEVRAGAQRLVPALDFSQAIKSFSGLRPESPQADFWLGPTPLRGFYQAGAMRSPGLTAAPAIAHFLSRELALELNLQPKRAWNPIRPAPPRVAEFSPGEWAELIRTEPRYGRVLCFCNLVTEGEVVEAIRRGARTLDGVKLRTRAGFGRCQGSFCADQILLILARELGWEPGKVRLGRPRSWVISGPVRP